MRKKIIVHDYSGHPFQIQLSRELARRGNEVIHVYSADFQTPKGDLRRRHDDPPDFRIAPLSIGEPFRKSTFVKRRSQEIKFGKLVAELIRQEQPSVVFSSNAPLDAQRIILKAVRAVPNCKFVFWLQDIYSKAIKDILSKKIPFLGRGIGKYYEKIEHSLLRRSDHIVCITQDFVSILQAAGLPIAKMTVVENWAPLGDIPLMPKLNDWSVKNGMADKKNIIYSGTLGYKHNPDALLLLAKSVDVDVHVFSEGKAADYLAKQSQAERISNLKVHPWVEFDELPSMLASAEIVVTIIEPDAGVFSVPSKVLTYMSAGRPVLALVPPENLAARILERENAGVVVSPEASESFVQQARKLLSNDQWRQELGDNGRAYAERQFDINVLGDKFQRILAAL